MQAPPCTIQAVKFYRLAWRQSHAKTIQGNLQTFASSFDVSFLPRPTKKERFRAQFGSQPMPLIKLLRREMAFRYIFAGKFRPDRFEVDPYISTARKGIDSQAAGVHQVEMNRRRATVRAKGGFSVRPILKFQEGWRAADILSEQFTQDSSGSDEVVSIAWKEKPVGAKLFNLRESGSAST